MVDGLVAKCSTHFFEQLCIGSQHEKIHAYSKHKKISRNSYILVLVLWLAARPSHEPQVIINFNALPWLLNLLSSAKKGIRKEACWTISNITAGNKEQIQAVIEANIIPPLIQLLSNAEFDIRKVTEAHRVLIALHFVVNGVSSRSGQLTMHGLMNVTEPEGVVFFRSASKFHRFFCFTQVGRFIPNMADGYRASPLSSFR